MRRFRKIGLWVLGVIFGLGVAGWLGLQWYLNTAGARRLAAEKLSAMLGLPVEVKSLDVGLGSTSVALVIPDPAADPPTAFLRVGTIDTDITLLGLITGSASPTRVTVRDADLVLRLDANRKIVSPLPKFDGESGGKLPDVTIENARVRIRQPGKPEFDVTGVNATLRADGDGSAIRGDISDAKWGQWRIDGRLGADPTDGQVALACDAAHVNDVLLQSIPFVKAKVWKHLSASGPVSARVALAFKPDGDFRYEVDVNTKGTTVWLPDAAVTLTNAAVGVRVADGKVTTAGGTLELAGGRIDLGTSEFDFEKDVYVMKLKLSANGVDVVRLPDEWGLKRTVAIGGKLKGDADLEIRMGDDGKLDTRGTGDAVVKDDNYFGGTAEVKVRLLGDKGRYRFESMPGGR